MSLLNFYIAAYLSLFVLSSSLLLCSLFSYSRFGGVVVFVIDTCVIIFWFCIIFSIVLERLCLQNKNLVLLLCNLRKLTGVKPRVVLWGCVWWAGVLMGVRCADPSWRPVRALFRGSPPECVSLLIIGECVCDCDLLVMGKFSKWEGFYL